MTNGDDTKRITLPPNERSVKSRNYRRLETCSECKIESLEAELERVTDELADTKADLEISIEAQRCECGFDDVCKFAREADEARRELCIIMEEGVPGDNKSASEYAESRGWHGLFEKNRQKETV